MEAANLLVLLQDIAPHVVNAAHRIPLILTNIGGKVIARVRDKSPAVFCTPGDKKLIASAPRMRSDGIRPFDVSVFHRKVDVVSEELPT